METGNKSSVLGSRQLLGIAGLAVSFWLNGIFMIRFITSHGLWGGRGSAIIFALSVPIATFAIMGTRKLLHLTREQLSPGISLIVAVVALLHGLALTWAPWMYGTGGPALLLASAWLVWFCGAVLVPLFIMQTGAEM